MSDVLELQEFFVEGGDRSLSHVLLHIAEPSTPEEKKKGYFFGLTEINGGTVEHIEQIQRLIDDVQSGYYDTDDTETKDAFELSIEHVNRRGHHILQYEGVETHCIVGVLRGTSISLSYHGAPEAALLYRRGADTEYLDILGSGDDGRDPTRLFSSILQGSLSTNDSLYIASPQVRDFFSSDRIKKLIASRPTKQAVDHVQKVLAGLRNGASYGGILFHILPEQEAPRTGKQPAYILPAESPSEHRGDKETSGRQNIETNLRPRPKNNEPFLGPLLATMGRGIVGAIILAARLFKKIGIALAHVLLNLLIILSNKGGQRGMALEKSRESFRKFAKKISDLPIATKALLAIIAVAGLFVAGSVVILRMREQKALVLRHEAELVAAIRDKKDAADARLIYGDTATAYQLLIEAKGLIPQLSNNTAEKKTQEEALSHEINTVLMTLRKWTDVHGEVVTDLSKASPAAKPAKLALLAGALIAYGPDDTQLYRIDTATKKIDIIDHKTIPALRAGNTPKEDDMVVFAAGDQSAAAYAKDAGVTGRDISFPQKNAAIADLFVYNQKLFTLDPNTGQIYKHAKTQTGYDRGTPWIKKSGDANLSDAVSMAIDGDVYVAAKSGKILKFTGGELAPFTISGIDPPLDAPAIVWTYNNVNNLYILEPANKRLIVLDKTGKLLAQYSDPAWTAPTGMVVDEAKKTAYVLDNNKVYKIGL